MKIIGFLMRRLNYEFWLFAGGILQDSLSAEEQRLLEQAFGSLSTSSFTGSTMFDPESGNLAGDFWDSLDSTEQMAMEKLQEMGKESRTLLTQYQSILLIKLLQLVVLKILRSPLLFFRIISTIFHVYQLKGKCFFLKRTEPTLVHSTFGYHWVCFLRLANGCSLNVSSSVIAL